MKQDDRPYSKSRTLDLRVYNTKTLNVVRYGRPTIRFNSAGIISISGTAAQNMNLVKGDTVELCKDANSGDWFIRKAVGNDGFELRGSKNSLALTFNSSALAKTILEETTPYSKSTGFPVSKQPQIIDGVNHFYILTKDPITKNGTKD